MVLGSGWGATSLLKHLDTEDYNVVRSSALPDKHHKFIDDIFQVVISPKNYFLFTPLLPSVAVGTLSTRSILQPTRYITRHKTRTVSVIEAEAKSVDVRSFPLTTISHRSLILTCRQPSQSRRLLPSPVCVLPPRDRIPASEHSFPLLFDHR